MIFMIDKIHRSELTCLGISMTSSNGQQLLTEVQALQQQSVLSGADRIKLWRNVVQLTEVYPLAQAPVAAHWVDMQQALLEAQAAKDDVALSDVQRRRVFRNLHDLAEAEYQPVFKFLITCINHRNGIWRWQSLCHIGFHYSTAPDSLFLEKTRELLCQDPERNVRHAAALILGLHSQWQDAALVTALTSDPEPDIRAVAFASLLELAGMARCRAWKCWQQVKTGKIQPTWEEVQRRVGQEGIDPNDAKLSRKRQTEIKVK